VRGDVVRHVVVDGALGAPGGLQPDHRRQRLVGHRDALGGVLGDVAVAGHDHRHRLADVPHHAVGQRVGGPRGVQAGVGDQQRQRLGDPAVEVLVGVDGDQAVDVQRAADVDVEDPRVGVRAAHEGRRQRAGAEVVEEAAVAAGQPGVLPPGDRLAEDPGGHGSGAPSPFSSSAARSTEATMFW